MKKFLPKIAQYVMPTIVALIFTVGLNYLLAATWVGPGQPPPGGNVDAPINVGSTAQAKTGGLSLGTSIPPASGSYFKINCPAGDCNAKVLTSDASGSATWQSSAATVSNEISCDTLSVGNNVHNYCDLGSSTSWSACFLTAHDVQTSGGSWDGHCVIRQGSTWQLDVWAGGGDDEILCRARCIK